MSSQELWTALNHTEIRALFGATTVHEQPVAFRSVAGEYFVVLRGEMVDGSEEETLWWGLCRIESGEVVELARDYGVEEVEGEVIEVSWDGLFPTDWVAEFAAGKVDWIRLSVTEIFEKFGDTVDFEQPQAWRHREGEYYLVLVGEVDEETEEEEYSWSLVREQGGEYVEVSECNPGNDFGAEELQELGEPTVRPQVPVVKTANTPEESAFQDDEGEQEEDISDADDLFDGWWEVPPFEWGSRMVVALARHDAED